MLATLSKHMTASGQDEAKVKELADTFNKFCIEANNLENAYNTSASTAASVLDHLEDFLFRVSKNAKVDVKGTVNTFRNQLKEIKDPFYTANYAERLSALSEKLGTAMVLITHDLGIVAKMCDKVAIMYAGEMVEQGTIEDILTGDFHHPYTLGLLGSIPNLEEDTDRLKPIPGLMPPPNALPEGCRFHPRCAHCMEICKHKAPEQHYEHDGHYVACHLFAKEGQRDE